MYSLYYVSKATQAFRMEFVMYSNTMEHNLKYNFYIDFQSLFKVATEK